MKNLVSHSFKITKNNKEKLHNHRSFLVWFTGLSGSGKSTIADLVQKELHDLKISTFILDGDSIRQGINKDLSFSPQDRTENIRRISEIANLFIESGQVVLAAFVSPYIKDRQLIKEIVGLKNFYEIYINTSLEECEKRDVKGLYAKARKGEIKNMTGITAPYETPVNPDLEIITDNQTISESVSIVLEFIKQKVIL